MRLRAGRRPARAASPAASSPAGASTTCATGCAASTDERTDEVLRGRASVTSPGCPSATSSGWARRCWPGSCRASTRRCSTRSTRHQDAGRADLHRQRRRQRPGRDCWRAVLGMDGGIGTRYEVGPDGSFTGRARRPVRLRRGQGRGDAPLRRRARHRPRRLLRLLRLGLRPADAARGRATRSSSTPTPPLLEIARQEGWQVMRFEQLGRKLAIAGAHGPRGRAGGAGALASRRREHPRPASDAEPSAALTGRFGVDRFRYQLWRVDRVPELRTLWEYSTRGRPLGRTRRRGSGRTSALRACDPRLPGTCQETTLSERMRCPRPIGPRQRIPRTPPARSEHPANATTDLGVDAHARDAAEEHAREAARRDELAKGRDIDAAERPCRRDAPIADRGGEASVAPDGPVTERLRRQLQARSPRPRRIGRPRAMTGGSRHRTARVRPRTGPPLWRPSAWPIDDLAGAHRRGRRGPVRAEITAPAGPAHRSRS